MTAHHAVVGDDVTTWKPASEWPEIGECGSLVFPCTQIARLHPCQRFGKWSPKPTTASPCISRLTALYAEGKIGLEEKAMAASVFVLCQRMHKAIGCCWQTSAPAPVFDILKRQIGRQILLNSRYSKACHIGDNQVCPSCRCTAWMSTYPRAVLQELTCDSMAKWPIHRQQSIETTCPIHALNGERNFWRVFGGAYQEILGDMHNLFGDTDSVMCM